MLVYINVFTSWMKIDFLTQVNDTLSQCIIYSSYFTLIPFRNLLIWSISIQASVVIINFALVVDNAIYFCNFNCQEIAPPAKVAIKQEVDFLESGSPPMTASAQPFNIDLPFSKHKHTLEFPRRYPICLDYLSICWLLQQYILCQVFVDLNIRKTPNDKSIWNLFF